MPGTPKAFACEPPKPLNTVEQTVMPVLPAFVISTLSWTLHDAQEPQSPEPQMTKSHSSAKRAITSFSAGTEAARFW